MASHVVLQGLLPDEDAAALLAHAIARREDYAPSAVGRQSVVDHGMRRSRLLTDIGPWAGKVQACVQTALPQLLQTLGIAPFAPSRHEIELVAHEDGAFYGKHIDLHTGAMQADAEDRILSVVLYLQREPRAYDGGALRLWPEALSAARGDTRPVDIAPGHNMAVVFPSWLLHEVRPVRCESGRFEDARFAVNCWVYRRRRSA